jgi:small-conductance mechanosensitive channel
MKYTSTSCLKVPVIACPWIMKVLVALHQANVLCSSYLTQIFFSLAVLGCHVLTEDHLDKWSETPAHHIIEVYRYGCECFQSTLHFTLFEAQVLTPAETDRAHAASQSQYGPVIEKLKKIWGSKYTAFDSTWMSWAVQILKEAPTVEAGQDARINNGRIPDKILLQLTPHPTITARQMERVEQETHLSVALIEQLRSALAPIKQTVSLMTDLAKDAQQRFEMLEKLLSMHGEMLETVGNRLAPTPLDLRNAVGDQMLQSVTNQMDVDHAEEEVDK